MRIGILPCLNPSSGGVYQYSLTILESLRPLQQEGLTDEFLICHWEQARLLDSPIVASWPWVSLHGPKPVSNPMSVRTRILDIMRRSVGEGPHREAWRRLRDQLQPGWRPPPVTNPPSSPPDPDKVYWQPHLTRRLRRYRIKLMLYPIPSALSFEIGIPYVMAIHDLQHRLQPEFAEVSANGEWEAREYLFRNAARFATLLLADSEVGKEDILTFYGAYGVTPDRVKVLPFLPAHYLSQDVDDVERQHVLHSFGLVDPYLFYPAHFWPHKNHARIVKALSLLKAQQNLEVHVVFVGSYSGDLREQTFQQVMHLVRQGHVARQVHYLGYVPEQYMAALYAGSRGLIMPTFFGPTNIPPLEAWSFGRPVITSDIRGIREQMGDAAILVDPRSVESIAAGIARVWTDESLRQELAARGRTRLAAYTPADFRQRLKAILEEAKDRVRSGNTPRIPVRAVPTSVK